VKRRRVNLNHIELLQDKLDIKRGASDDEVAKELKVPDKPATKARAAKKAPA
jgi:ribosomal protein L14E/L6E/L27E